MPVEAQFSDSLYALERLQMLRLALWSGASLVLGTTIVAWLRITGRESALLSRFGAWLAGSGAILALLVLIWRADLRLRDLAGAVALDRALWFALGAATSGVVAGAVLALRELRRERGGAVVGVGLAVSTQALAVALLALQLSRAIVR